MTNFDEIVTDERLRLDVCNAHLETPHGRRLPVRPLPRHRIGRLHRPPGRLRLRMGRMDHHVPRLQRYELRRQAEERRDRPGPVTGWRRSAAGRASHASESVLPDASATDDSCMRRRPRHAPGRRDRRRAQRTRTPMILFAYPSALLPAGGSEPGPDSCAYVPGGSWSPPSRSSPRSGRPPKETWGVPVINVYGSSEAGGMAVGCGAGAGAPSGRGSLHHRGGRRRRAAGCPRRAVGEDLRHQPVQPHPAVDPLRDHR